VIDILNVVVWTIGGTLAALRWLRVAQREHYLPGSVTRFAGRWWTSTGLNAAAAVVIVLSALGALFFGGSFVGAVFLATAPYGLSIKGTAPGPMAWTRRLKTLAGVVGLLYLIALGIGVAFDSPGGAAAMASAAMPLLVDAALAITAPLERHNGQGFVRKAEAKLRHVGPTTIAITGSYGKTSTKGYVAHLIEGAKTVLPTPRSFNNSAGLARAVNEHLALGTEVFVAEMGTYGPGEIAEMCRWVRPSIAAITAIGPVHLERMRSEEVITEAKAEIFSTADTAVLNVDSPYLAALVPRLEQQGKTVIRCSALDPTADVVVSPEGVVTVGGTELTTLDELTAPPTNVAVAIALARAVGVPDGVIAARLPTIPTAQNRLAITTLSTGATAIDDTYNANPAGATAALHTLQRLAQPGRRAVVVTPGMIELGHRQRDENRRFAEAAAAVATDVIVVGRTNRKALKAGAPDAIAVDDHASAVAWVQGHTGPGDVVLYENQLPDHFP
jgi:UDP-N-acetylmuramoyl-tripeptide--D-alanyl-D-alanine ligase